MPDPREVLVLEWREAVRETRQKKRRRYAVVGLCFTAALILVAILVELVG